MGLTPMLRRLLPILLLGVLAVAQETGTPRTVSILADHDSRYKIDGKASPTLRLKAGEEVRLVITAVKAKSQNRDGSIHGFALLKKDGSRVENWDLLLKPGVQEFILRAPQAGEYRVVWNAVAVDTHHTSGHFNFTVKGA